MYSLHTSQSATILGITFDTHFNVTAQIVNSIRTPKYYLYNIRKTRNMLTFNFTKCLIHALVFSRLRYCCSLFTTLPLNLLHRLETIQRRAVRILYKLNRRTMVSISSLMHSLGWLKFRLVCKYRLLCITHRAIYQARPKYLANVITMRTDYRPRCVGVNIVIHLPISTTVYAESTFAVAAPKCWNALPADIRSTESEPLFKRKLYNYFISL